MNYRRMGRTGLKVSELSLGTMTFGVHTDISEAERMLSLSFDAGINFIDTADAYGGGQSEEMLGKLLGVRREDTVWPPSFSIRWARESTTPG